MCARKIKVCVDRILPADMRVEAAQIAIAESPANTPILSFHPGLGVTPPSPLEMALLTGKKWQNGRKLRVRFLDGSDKVQAKVKEYADQWSKLANIQFDFDADSDAEIRISFRRKGSWSFLGTDALAIAANEPTMNFGWLTDSTAEEEYSRVVLHEFGHALGCIHEHQHPTAGIPWDKDAVYRYYAGPPNNWTRAQVDSNLFHLYSQTITQFSQFDPTSIMLYAIPNQFTIGDVEFGWNRGLSLTDREFISVMYPFETRSATELVVGAAAISTSIGKHGEEDLFKFNVATDDRYTIETNGSTDVVMSLFGPDNQAELIASDDDSGRGWNAKIVTILKPGAYYLRVRHNKPAGVGKYRIKVKV